MLIPHRQLSPAALRAVVEEFVTRDGTDHSSVQQRIQQVLHQLDLGSVELHFDQQTETCHVHSPANSSMPPDEHEAVDQQDE